MFSNRFEEIYILRNLILENVNKYNHLSRHKMTYVHTIHYLPSFQ